jgi:predicted nucleic acid-binding Zn ribbon protein
MATKTSRSANRRPRRRINWQRMLFMFLGLLVVVAFVLSMVTAG